ncbi:MAG: autotransporter-associated beta strand repeat-containing protein, partial [Kiritimatiellales bacterium]
MKKKVLGIMLMAAGLCFAAQAADVIRATVNTNNIESGPAWEGGIAPTSADVAVWDRAYGTAVATNALGADVSWQGIRMGTTVGRGITINGITPTITLGSAGIDLTQARFNFTINPNVALNASQTWSVSNSRTLTVNGIVSGGAANVLTKDDLGTLTLNGANSYSGGTVHNAGTLIVGNASALGTGGLTMKSGSILQSGIDLTLANNVTLDGDATFAGANNIKLDGVISGSGSLTKKAGAGIVLTLTGANTYSGGTTNFNGGRITIQNVNALGTGTYTVDSTAGKTVTYLSGDLHAGNGGFGITNDIAVIGTDNNFNALHSDVLLSGTISGSGSLGVNGFNDGLLTLTGNNTGWSGGVGASGVLLKLGHVNAAGTGDITLLGNVSQLGVSTDLSAGNGVMNDVSLTSVTSTTINIDQNLKLSGVISGYGGSSGVIKSGTGSLILSGLNTYTGLTSVAAGKLVVAGVLASDVTVQNGGALGGSGSINGPVTVDAGGMLEAGNSPGTLTFNSDVLLSDGSTNIMEITDIAYDILMGAATNTLTMSGVTVLDFTGFTGGVTNGYTLAWSELFQSWGATNVTGTATYSALGLAPE